jgi:hypothetical protein
VSITKEDHPFDAEAIRDTSVHTSPITENVGFALKTLIIENDLNQVVTFTCEGSARSDFSKYFVIASWEHAANTTSYATCESYIPYWRIKAQCSVAPTSGTLTVFLEKVSD